MGLDYICSKLIFEILTPSIYSLTSDFIAKTYINRPIDTIYAIKSGVRLYMLGVKISKFNFEHI